MAFVAVIGAAADIPALAQNGAGDRYVPAVTILPLANNSGNMTAVERLLPLIARQLDGMAVDVKGADTTRQILRRHRIRAIGRIDHAGAHALARDLGVDYLLTGAVDVYAPGRVPEIGLSLRLVDAQTLRIVWARSVGMTGDDRVSVFGLGRVESLDVLAERAVAATMESLEQALTADPASGPDIHEAVYDVMIIAADSTLADSDVVTITVVDIDNEAPALSAVAAPRATETSVLEFAITARDRDGTVPHLFAADLPVGAAFRDHGDGKGTMTWTPGFTDAGEYAVTFVASDGVLADSVTVVIVVDDVGNQAPIVSAPDSARTDEGVPVTFTVSATDVDGTIPALRIPNLPVGASFSDRGDGTAVFAWTPGFAAAGIHNVLVIASDGTLTDSTVVIVTVADAGNQTPELTVIGPEGTIENVALSVAVFASDPDATIPILRAHGVPDEAVFVDHGDGTGTLNWMPGFTDAGVYPVSIVASDGVLTDSEVVEIIIGEARNQIPVLAGIGPQNTTENAALSVGVAADDRDRTIPRLHAVDLPAGAAFADHGDGTGTLDWTPGFANAGAYRVLIVASDGAAADSEWVSITVHDAGNQAPVLTAIPSLRTAENVTVVFGVAATDADGTIPNLKVVGLPEAASFVNYGDGTGVLDWTPGFADAGVYDMTAIASDGLSADSETVSLTVIDAGNQPPVLAVERWQGTTENVPLTLGVSASDPDATIPILSATALPPGATFADHYDGTATFYWTPDSTQLGVHQVTLVAFDGEGADTQAIEISVQPSDNRTPVLSALTAPRTTETSELEFVVTAGDPDETTPYLSAAGLPEGAAFRDHRDGRGTLTWTPGFTDAGTYAVTFVASDGVLADSKTVTITVDDIGNQAPDVSVLSSQRTGENKAVTFSVSASDVDGTIPALRVPNLPEGASFTDRGDGAGVFDWTPGFAVAGTYDVMVIASDGVSADSVVVTVTVDDAGNQAPELTAIGPQGAMENGALHVRVRASDPDATVPILQAHGLPGGASFVDLGTGIGTLDWVPGFTDAGVYSVSFVASDGTLADSEVIEITIGEVGNQTPIMATVRLLGTTENVTLTVPVSAVDPDMTTPRLRAVGVPAGGLFVDHGDGTGTLDWTPGYADAGIYHVLIVASDGTSADSEWVSITVQDAGNQAPVWAAIESPETTEGAALRIDVSADDPDATIPNLHAAGLPAGASFVDHGDGTGTLDWTPDFTDAGTHDMTMIASDGALADSLTVSLSVVDAGNQPPVLVVDRRRGTIEREALTFTISAPDPDATIPVLSARALPPGATLTDHADGTATFDWTPAATDDLGRERIALVPFDDLEPELHGGHIVAGQVLTQLVARGFMVVDPGTVHELGLTFGRTPRGGIDYELLAALRDSLGCTSVITGVVDELRLSSPSAEQSFPSMTAS
ncbi:MAG TPA: putative Ig domain-containing protein, partial [Acidobacteriota bacterium]|nr:putative Ig domain-containing protein [Acidobacteriota bacterium]